MLGSSSSVFTCLTQAEFQPDGSFKLDVCESLPVIHRIEMNIIIIAACIPTLRPLFLILFKHKGSSQYRSGRDRRHSSYQKAADSNDTKPLTVASTGPNAFANHGINAPQNTKWSHTDGTISTTSMPVSNRDGGSQDDDMNEEEWGHSRGNGVPLSEIG